jgi:hypothetical protein
MPNQSGDWLARPPPATIDGRSTNATDKIRDALGVVQIQESFMAIKDAHDEPAHRPGPGADPLSFRELDHGVTTRPPLEVREARS